LGYQSFDHNEKQKNPQYLSPMIYDQTLLSGETIYFILQPHYNINNPHGKPERTHLRFYFLARMPFPMKKTEFSMKVVDV
jgi:hypothetical protein